MVVADEIIFLLGFWATQW